MVRKSENCVLIEKIGFPTCESHDYNYLVCFKKKDEDLSYLTVLEELDICDVVYVRFFECQEKEDIAFITDNYLITPANLPIDGDGKPPLRKKQFDYSRIRFPHEGIPKFPSDQEIEERFKLVIDSMTSI